MTWMLYKVVANATIPVVDNSSAVVVCNIQSLNTAKVKCASTTPIDTDTEVVIQDYVVNMATGELTEIHNILRGVVVKYTELTKGSANNTYEYDISELAATLDYYRVHSGTSYTVNFSAASTILQCVNQSLLDTGWSVGTKHDGSADTIGSAIQLQDMTVIRALNKFVIELGADDMDAPSYMWFDSDLHTVNWGSYRADRRADLDFKKGVYYGREEYKTVRYQVPGVKVYGSGKTSSGQYPDPFTSHKIAVYQYDDATTNAECDKLAYRIYTDYTVDPKRRIQFKLRPNQTKPAGTYILEGDLIKVDSEAAGYVITDVTYSPKEVQVGTITTEASIIASLGDRLRPISGGTGGPIYQSWNPGTQDIGGT